MKRCSATAMHCVGQVFGKMTPFYGLKKKKNKRQEERFEVHHCGPYTELLVAHSLFLFSTTVLGV